VVSIADKTRTGCKEKVRMLAQLLDIPGSTIGLARLDGLACLLDLLEDGFVGEGLLGNNIGGLGFERDVVRLDACNGLIFQFCQQWWRAVYLRAS
jgi:hypothetical protein